MPNVITYEIFTYMYSMAVGLFVVASPWLKIHGDAVSRLIFKFNKI